MLILDTDHLTIIQRRSEPAYSSLRSRLKMYSEEDVCSTIINFEEQMRGWLSAVASAKDGDKEIKAYRNLRLSLSFFQDMRLLDYDEAAKIQFFSLQKSRIRVGTMDLKIAAIAISQNARLLSRNLKDFQKVPALMVEDWTIAVS